MKEVEVVKTLKLLNSEEIDAMLIEGEIRYLGILTIHGDLWILDREKCIGGVVSKGQMAETCSMKFIAEILRTFKEENSGTKRELVKKLKNALLKSNRLCRLKS
jgi:polyhydroxyalkanoate synthesis regulator phasin